MSNVHQLINVGPNPIKGPTRQDNVRPEHPPICLDQVAKIYDIIDPKNPNRILADFQYLEFIDSNIVDFTDPWFTQVGIKTPSEVEDGVEEMMNALWQHGWDTDLGLNWMDTEGKEIDGRTKLQAGHNLNMIGIPTARFEWRSDVTDLEKWEYIATINPETEVAGTKITRNYFVNNGRKLMEHGGLQTRSEIDHWVDNVSGASKKFRDKKDLTIIKNELKEILDSRGKGSTDFVRRVTNTVASEWISETLTDMGEYEVLAIDHKDGAKREFMKSILPHLAKDSNHTKKPRYVLYSKTSGSGSELKDRAQAFLGELDECVSNVERVVLSSTNETVSFDGCFEILGFVPQILCKDHGFYTEGFDERVCTRTTLVSVEELLGDYTSYEKLDV